MERLCELKRKEIINICDGFRFGFLCDLEIELGCGRIVAIIVPAPGKVFGLFCREKEFRIPWECIKRIGEDIILVDVNTERITVRCD